MTKQQIQQIELDYNVQVLYITKSGSNLYGTATPDSDIDYKGIFLPTKSDRLLGADLDFISLDSNKTNQANTSDDIDFHLDSIHKFFKLLAKGETGAIDLLFSMWSTQPVYAEYFFTTWCKKNYLSLITSNPHAFVGYAKGMRLKFKHYDQQDLLTKRATSWKALSHALRVVLEVKELLTDSFITFPLRDAQYLREIKQGHLEIQSVLAHLETLITEIDDLLLTTSLNKTVDQQLVNQYILKLYGETQ